MNVLFICNQNENRSKTAETLFKDQFTTKSAGLYNKVPLSEQQVQWADLVVTMEDIQRTEISKRFPKEYMKKRIISLDVPDIYAYGTIKLNNILIERMKELA